MPTDPATETASGTTMRLSDIGIAFALLTRLPVPSRFHDPDRITPGAWAFPVVGAVLGALAGLMLWALTRLGVPPGPAAALALAFGALLTGALHEDGLADCADGLWGGGTSERRLEIMRDSRIGTYGALALMLSVLVRWSALSALALTAPLVALVAAGSLARAPMTLAMAMIPQARADGLAASAGRPDARHAAAALALAAAIALAATGFAGLVLLLVAFAAPLPLLAVARRRIGGITGDVLGAMEQLSEMAVLVTLAALIA